jgi:hypothetical protein
MIEAKETDFQFFAVATKLSIRLFAHVLLAAALHGFQPADLVIRSSGFFRNVLMELHLLLPIVLSDASAVVVPIATFFVENVPPALFPFDDFILFLDHFYVSRIEWPTLPSIHPDHSLSFPELEVLPSAFLRILFFVKSHLPSDLGVIGGYLTISELSPQSRYFFAEFFAHTAWQTHAKFPFLELLVNRPLDSRFGSGDLWRAASCSPTVDLTEAVIGGWERSSDFQRVETALYLSKALNQPQQAVRRLVHDFLDRSLDPHEWGSPEFEISVFHFLLMDPARVVAFILGTWVDVTPNPGLFQLVSSSLFVRYVRAIPRFPDVCHKLISNALQFHLPIWREIASFLEQTPRDSFRFFLANDGPGASSEFFARAICRGLLPNVCRLLKQFRFAHLASPTTPFTMVMVCCSLSAPRQQPFDIPFSECDLEIFSWLADWTVTNGDLWRLCGRLCDSALPDFLSL